MVELPAEVEQALRDLPENEWSALQSRLRPPDPAEQVRAAVAQHVPKSQLDAIMGRVKTSAFLDENGQVNEAKVGEHFGNLFGSRQPPAPRQWGQHSGPGGPPTQPGDGAKAALAKRHGVKNDTNHPTAGTQSARGAGGRAALQRRHGGKR
jgi:hypothetical protein